MTDTHHHVSLISEWFVKPGNEAAVIEAATPLAEAVLAKEPDTLTYLVHVPMSKPPAPSRPTPDPSTIMFFEIYRDGDAFLAHVNGPTFTGFVKKHGHLFEHNKDGSIKNTVEFLTRKAGFIRPAAE